MKHVLLLFSLFLAFGITSATAQCSKSAAKKCTKAEMKACHGDKAMVKMSDEKVMKAAVKAASLDETIEQKVCDETGKVSFVKKSVCEKSGKVSFANVEYDAATAKFVNVAPSAEAGAKEGKACCAGAAKAGCCSKAKAKVEKKETKAIKAKI